MFAGEGAAAATPVVSESQEFQFQVPVVVGTMRERTPLKLNTSDGCGSSLFRLNHSDHPSVIRGMIGMIPHVHQCWENTHNYWTFGD